MPITSSKQAAPSPAAQPAAAPQAPRLDGESPAAVIEVPFEALFARLPEAVRRTGIVRPGNFRLPVALARTQLARGSVKIRYAQLRDFSPADAFPPNPSLDSQEVELPVSLIVPRLGPELLSRKANQRKLEIPTDVPSIFGPDGSPIAGLKVSDQKAATPPPKPPASAPSSEPVRTATPAASVNESVSAVIPPLPLTETPPETKPPPSVIASPEPPPAPLQDAPIRAPLLDPSLASSKPRNANVFPIALMDLAAHWSSIGQTDLADLYRHSAEIPMDRVEAGLKRGKLAFTWREFQAWIKLAPGNTLKTLPNDLQVELPLKFVAPRFMESRVGGRPAKRVEIGDDIPDVFAPANPQNRDLPLTASPASAANSLPATVPLPKPPGPAVPAVAAVPIASAPDAAAAALPPPQLDYGAIFGQPEKKAWTLTEVVERCAALRGATGAIITTTDGLLVAAHWPEGAKSDAVAAFIPQLFNRTSQYARELKLGEPTSLTLLLDNLPLQIFKGRQTYFAVLGRSGENLPKVQLNAIAMRLAQESKPQ